AVSDRCAGAQPAGNAGTRCRRRPGCVRSRQVLPMTSSTTWQTLARSLIGDPALTAGEVATQAGVDLEHARRLRRALGFPPVPDDDRVFTQSDVAMLRGVRVLLDTQSTDADVLLQLTRVTGQSLARIAEAQVAASSDRVAAAYSAAVSDEAIDAIVDRT